MSDGSVDVEIKLEDKRAKSQANKVGKDIGNSVKDGAKTAEKALDGVSSKFGSAFKDGSKAASESIKGVKDDIDGVGDESDNAGGRFSQAFGSAIPIAAAAAAAAIALVVAKVVEFTKESVDVGMGFDKAMSQVAATMGKTVDEIQELNDFAQEMGATTAFSATQSAEALNYMALAGYDAETSMAMLPTVLNLAAAGGMELATASDMVTDAQSALGLSLDEISEMVDKMAMASSKSNTSVAQLGEAFLTVGGTAKNLSGGTTELAMSLGVLADNGVKGAEGGTALRNIILSLSAPTDKARESIEALGLQVFDSEGNMRALDDVFGDLSATLSTMTQEEQTQVLNEIFNKVDLKSVNALLGTSAERFDELAANIDNAQGSAQKMADTQLDNLAGDITLLESATEGFQISISNYLTPSLRALAQVGGTAFSELKASWDESMGSGNFVGTGEEIGRQIINVVNTLIAQLPELIATGVELLGGFLVGIAESIPSLLTAIVSAITQAIPLIIEAAINVVQALIVALPGIVDALIDALPQMIEAIAAAIPATVDLLVNGITQLVYMIAAALPQIVETLVEQMPLIIKQMVTALLSSVTVLVEGFVALFTGVIQALPVIIAAIVPMIPDIVNGIVEALVESLPALIDGFVQLFMAFVDATPIIINNILPQIPRIISSIVAALIQNVPRLIDAGVRLFNGFLSGITKVAANVVSFVASIPGRILSALGDVGNLLVGAGRSIINGFLDGLRGAFENVKNFVGGIGQWIADHKGPREYDLALLIPNGEWIMQSLVTGMKKGMPLVQSMVEGIATDMSDSLQEKLGGLMVVARSVGIEYSDSLVEGFDMNNPMSQIADTVRSGFDAISMMVQTAGNSVTTNNQTLNFNSPVSSPDEIARTMRMQQRYGLAGQNL